MFDSFDENDLQNGKINYVKRFSPEIAIETRSSSSKDVIYFDDTLFHILRPGLRLGHELFCEII